MYGYSGTLIEITEFDVPDYSRREVFAAQLRAPSITQFDKPNKTMVIALSVTLFFIVFFGVGLLIIRRKMGLNVANPIYDISEIPAASSPPIVSSAPTESSQPTTCPIQRIYTIKKKVIIHNKPGSASANIEFKTEFSP